MGDGWHWQRLYLAQTVLTVLPGSCSKTPLCAPNSGAGQLHLKAGRKERKHAGSAGLCSGLLVQLLGAYGGALQWLTDRMVSSGHLGEE